MAEHSEKQSREKAEQEAALRYQRFLDEQRQLNLREGEVDEFATAEGGDVPPPTLQQAPEESELQVGLFLLSPGLVH